MNSCIRLTEFVELCEIPLAEVMRLIEIGVIKLKNLDKPPVMVDISQFELSDCIQEDLKNILTKKEDKQLVLTEKEIEFFSAKMIASLEEITIEAFELAEKWNNN